MKVKDFLEEKIFTNDKIRFIYIYNDTYYNGFLVNKTAYEIIQRYMYFRVVRKYRRLGSPIQGIDPTLDDILENYITHYEIRDNVADISSCNIPKKG